MRYIVDIMAITKAKKVPVASATSQFAYGTLLSYGPDLERVGRQTARLADRLLIGVPASELPIERCEYYLALDLEVAARSNITVPDSVLHQATLINSAIFHETQNSSPTTTDTTPPATTSLTP